LPGRSFARSDGSRATVVRADDFAYTDPVDGSVTTQQGVETQAARAPLVEIADQIAGVRERTGRSAPSVMT
jgi:phosphoglucomutase